MKVHPGGFTLLEVTAVLVVLALLTVFALPGLVRGTAGAEVRLCRDQLRRDLRAARAEAVGKMRETAVFFQGTVYTMDLGGEPLERSLPGGFSFVRVALGGEVEEGLRFWPDGRSNGAAIEAAAGGRVCRVTVREDGSLVFE
ncbi:MAG: prepilin-type N-terminal cleavage/methylation domain-containing protein [Patescibacteria group bacterium]